MEPDDDMGWGEKLARRYERRAEQAERFAASLPDDSPADQASRSDLTREAKRNRDLAREVRVAFKEADELDAEADSIGDSDIGRVMALRRKAHGIRDSWKDLPGDLSP